MHQRKPSKEGTLGKYSLIAYSTRGTIYVSWDRRRGLKLFIFFEVSRYSGAVRV